MASARQLAAKLDAKLPEALKWGRLKPGHEIAAPAPLFARLDDKPNA